MHHHLATSNKPTGPAGFDRFLTITNRTAPFASTDGQVFAYVPTDAGKGCLTLAVRSRAFRDWFFGESFAQFETVPKAQTWNAILHHLEAQASRYLHSTNIRVPRRVDHRGPGYSPEKILLDLSNPDGQFVEISPEGWHVDTSENTPFQTSSSTRALPEPAPANPEAAHPLDTLRATLNLGPAQNSNWLRALAWLLSALRPSGPFPILVLRGPNGCGKTFAARILRTIIDPSSSPFTPNPASARHLLTLARDNWILAFDHVSRFSPQITDALCRLTSGVGLSHREHGAREPLQLNLKRPVILTVTDRWTPPPDLASRCLIVTLPALSPETRCLESDLLDTIDASFPQILGALCDLVGHALASPVRASKLHALTRHADALSWSVSALPHLELELRQAFDAPPPPPPIVQSIQALLTPIPHWTGTATDLLKLVPICGTPKGISQQLNAATLDLLDAGIDVRFTRRHEGVKMIALDASPDFHPSPQPTEPNQLRPPAPAPVPAGRLSPGLVLPPSGATLDR